MADNVTAGSNDAGGAVFATDLVGGAHYPYSKIAFGADNTATKVSASDGLPVAVVGSVPVTGTFYQATQPVSGTVAISNSITVGGEVGVVAPVGAPIFVSLSDGASQITTLPVSLASLPALAAGTNGIGKLTANSGVIIGAVEIAASQTVGLAAGAAVIGHVILDSGAVTATLSAETTKVIGTVNLSAAQTLATVTTVSTVTNLSQLGGVAIAMNTGTRSTGTQRVTIATDDLVPVSLASVPSHAVTNAGTFVVQDNPQTSSGFLVSRAIDLSIANQGSTVAKNGAGQVYGWAIFNTNAAACYVKLYNKATGPTSADTPVVTLLIPGNTAGGGLVTQLNKGIAFSAGISYRATTAIADASAAAVAASEVSINLFYF